MILPDGGWQSTANTRLAFPLVSEGLASTSGISSIESVRPTEFCGRYGLRMDGGTWVGLGTLVTAIVGLTLVAWQLHEQRRTMRAEFGNLYIERYWQIDDALLMETKGSDTHNQHRHRYLRLFEDEFDVASLGFLDARQWRAWHAVLDDTKPLERLKDDLRVCNPANDEFVRLRACIRQRDHDGKPHKIGECLGRSSG